MSYNALLLAKARKELANSWSWYEERQPGLGDRFVKTVLEKITQIEKTPNRYPKRTRQYHEAIVPIFPFLIIYRISNLKKLVVVVSIFHAKRNPSKKLKE
jgi:plasmid stabilization system protein ParE